MTRGNLII